MRLAIMQPYFFPYIGYFQLMAAVDHFIIHDDVQWIKGGWINKNRFLLNGEPRAFSLPVKKDSSSLNINERFLSDDHMAQKEKLLRQLEGAYRKAPHFEETIELLRNCLSSDTHNISKFVTEILQKTCTHLGIDTPITLSSDLEKDNDLRAQDRVIEINKVMGADHYINPEGGTELYDKDTFATENIKLNFIKSRNIPYAQFGGEYVPFLSIIDVMMFNSKEKIAAMLGEFDLV